MRTIFAIQTDRFAEILARQHRVVSDFRRYAGEPVALGQPPDMRKAQVRGNRRVVRIFEIGRGQRGYQRREVVVFAGMQRTPKVFVGFFGTRRLRCGRLLFRREHYREIAATCERRGNEEQRTPRKRSRAEHRRAEPDRALDSVHRRRTLTLDHQLRDRRVRH